MLIKLKWLNELVDLSGISLTEIINKLNLYSTEVENAYPLITATQLVVGHVLNKQTHPNSDHLSVVNVDVGKDAPLQIVCGAPNIDVNQKVIVALVGAKLPGDVVIKQTKIRGIDSFGMVCSLQEIGIEKKFIDEKYLDGIYYFEEDVPVGMKAELALGLDDDVIEINVMPNRGDLLSLIGVAYELSALFNRPLKMLPPRTYKLAKQEKASITLENNLCSSYYGQILRNVKIKPSPQWLKSRLIAFGIRPINNVVDITNYILALFGQPLHAFDYDLLGNTILVRNAKENEELITLDGIKRKLNKSDLVITNGQIPVALAGVMGGLATEIHPDTQNILLEAAVFDPLTIRKTSTRLGLRSESSLRFERGISLNRTKEALNYATLLLVELAEAEVCGEANHAGIEKLDDHLITISSVKINHLLGLELSKHDIEEALQRLKFQYQVKNDHFLVYIPNRRSDIVISEDLIEEIARLHGYDKIPLTLPLDSQVGYLQNKQVLRRKIKSVLATLGLNEVITYSLVDSKVDNPKNNLKLLMPLSEEHSLLRTNIIPSILEVIKYNYARKNNNLAFFEISKVYFKENESIIEEEHLAGALSNTFTHTNWQQKSEKVDFFLVKGLLNQLFTELKMEISFLPYEKDHSILHPKRAAKITFNNEEIGYLAQLHPKYAQEHDLDEVYLFEITLDKIINKEKILPSFRQLKKLPPIERDLAFVLNKEVLASDIVNAIIKTDKQLISSVEIFDLYQGEKINENEKSLALKIVFSADEPLKDEQINQKIQKIIKDLAFRFKAKLRT